MKWTLLKLEATCAIQESDTKAPPQILTVSIPSPEINAAELIDYIGEKLLEEFRGDY